MNEIKPGFDGMPPVRDIKDIKNKKTQYTDEEKIKIAAKAAEVGWKQVAEIYGLKWQTVRSWKSRLLETKSAVVAATTATASINKARAETRTGQTEQTVIIIQSPDGHEITVDEIIAKIGSHVDKIYIRVDENAAYWVRGEENGSVNLW